MAQAAIRRVPGIFSNLRTRARLVSILLHLYVYIYIYFWPDACGEKCFWSMSTSNLNIFCCDNVTIKKDLAVSKAFQVSPIETKKIVLKNAFQ